jgi:hypothetical protein
MLSRERRRETKHRQCEQKVTEVTKADCHFETGRISSLPMLRYMTKYPLNFSDLRILCCLLF